MNIPFLDFIAPYRELQVELDAAYRRVMESGRYILGDELDALNGNLPPIVKRNTAFADVWMP